MKKQGESMDAKMLIRQVNICVNAKWQNSQLWVESEKMLEKMAFHFSKCDECRFDFDAQEYPDETLLDFEKRLHNTSLDDWICNLFQKNEYIL